MIKMLLAGGALSLCLTGVASAATYDVAFDGDTADFTAQIVTDGSDLVTSITGCPCVRPMRWVRSRAPSTS